MKKKAESMNLEEKVDSIGSFVDQVNALAKRMEKDHELKPGVRLEWHYEFDVLRPRNVYRTSFKNGGNNLIFFRCSDGTEFSAFFDEDEKSREPETNAVIELSALILILLSNIGNRRLHFNFKKDYDEIFNIVTLTDAFDSQFSEKEASINKMKNAIDFHDENDNFAALLTILSLCQFKPGVDLIISDFETMKARAVEMIRFAESETSKTDPFPNRSCQTIHYPSQVAVAITTGLWTEKESVNFPEADDLKAFISLTSFLRDDSETAVYRPESVSNKWCMFECKQVREASIMWLWKAHGMAQKVSRLSAGMTCEEIKKRLLQKPDEIAVLGTSDFEGVLKAMPLMNSFMSDDGMFQSALGYARFIAEAASGFPKKNKIKFDSNVGKLSYLVSKYDEDPLTVTSSYLLLRTIAEFLQDCPHKTAELSRFLSSYNILMLLNLKSTANSMLLLCKLSILRSLMKASETVPFVNKVEKFYTENPGKEIIDCLRLENAIKLYESDPESCFEWIHSGA